ncbi:UNVERIFIED_CONTAM: hypothetical protein K2H54_062501, partial [Gekko kuhli]
MSFFPIKGMFFSHPGGARKSTEDCNSVLKMADDIDIEAMLEAPYKKDENKLSSANGHEERSKKLSLWIKLHMEPRVLAYLLHIIHQSFSHLVYHQVLCNSWPSL